LPLDRWERVRDAEGQVVLLSGEPGIGKRGHAHALLAHIGGPQITVRQFQCSPHHINSAFYPFINQMQRAAGIELGDPSESRLDKLEQWLAAEYGALDEVAPLLASLLSIDGSGRYGSANLDPQRAEGKDDPGT